MLTARAVPTAPRTTRIDRDPRGTRFVHRYVGWQGAALSHPRALPYRRWLSCRVSHDRSRRVLAMGLDATGSRSGHPATR